MNQLCRQEREWNQRHQEILDAAAPLLLEQGYAGTTMQMIAEKAEFSVGYIYKHFPGKKELMYEIIDQQFSRYSELRTRITNHYPNDPLRIIREIVLQSTQILEDTTHMLPIFLANDSPGPERVRERFQWARQEDARLFKQAMDLGLIHHSDPDLIATALDGAFLGLLRSFMESDELNRAKEIPHLLEKFIIEPLTKGCTVSAVDHDRKDSPPA